MSAPGINPAAPLEAHDPARAKTRKAKIRDRISDVRRHLLALRAAMAEFGEDFDLDAFSTAYKSDDPIELNRRLQTLRELRRMLIHEYATATAEQVHESALLVAGDFPAFYDAYRAWIKRGFSPTR